MSGFHPAATQDDGDPPATVLNRRWVVLREGERRRWGGDLRRRYLFDGLVARTGATVVEDWKPGSMTRALRRRRREVWRRSAFVVSSELLADAQLDAILRFGIPQAVDIHDDALLQAEALGVELPADQKAALAGRRRANLDAFAYLVAPSAPFARLAGLPSERLIVAPNGTDTSVVRPVAPGSEPGVAFVSGAAPSRGIEELIEAVRLVRRDLPDTRLLLFLAATGDASRLYLDALRDAHRADSWVEFGEVPYGELGAGLGRASVLCIPTPRHAYWDSVPPLKLFDGMACGRPHVTTPRTETARIVRDHDAGLVSEDDSAAAMAASLKTILRDDDLARRLGANARAAAEREFDWNVIGARLADELIARSRPWLPWARRPTRTR